MKLHDVNAWLTETEACQLLDIKPRTLRYHCHRGNVEKKRTEDGLRYRLAKGFAKAGQTGSNGNGNATPANTPNPAPQKPHSIGNAPLPLLPVGNNGNLATAPLPVAQSQTVPLELFKAAQERIAQLSDKMNDLVAKNARIETERDADRRLWEIELNRIEEEMNELYGQAAQRAELRQELSTTSRWRWKKRRGLRDKLESL